MTGFFKKKRQSTLAKKQQQQSGVGVVDGDPGRSASSSSSLRSHNIQNNPNSSPNLSKLQFLNHSSPQNKYQAYSASPNQLNYQYSPAQKQASDFSGPAPPAQHHHYNTANIPPQSNFPSLAYLQQQQVQSKSAIPGHASQFSSPQFDKSPQRFGQQQFQSQQYHNPYRQLQPQPQQQQFAAPQPLEQQLDQQQSQHQRSQNPQAQPLQQHYKSGYVRSDSSDSRRNNVPEQLITRESLQPKVTRTPIHNFSPDSRVLSTSSTPQSVISRSQATTPWKRKKLFNSPFPRYRHTASTITADNGCLFVMGGLRDDNVYGDIWLVAPIANDVSLDYSYIAKPIETVEGVPAPRVCHNSILIGNAFIVYGGDTIKLNLEGELDNNLYFFNINSMKWTTPSPSGLKPSGRYGHSITVVTFQNNNEQEVSSWSSYLYLFGGQLDDEKFNDMWCFDLSNFRSPTTQWRQIYGNDLNSQYQPPPLSNHTMTVYNGRIYIYGGSTTGGELSNALYSFNPVDESWSACHYTSSYQLPAVEEHSSILYQNLLISYGGKDSHGSTVSDFTVINLDTFQVYRIETPPSETPGRRAGHSLTYDMKNEKLLVMGGDQLNLENTNSSRDDVVFDGLNKSEKNDEILNFTSIDPLSLEYETTYVYEFDLASLDTFLNKTPDPYFEPDHAVAQEKETAVQPQRKPTFQPQGNTSDIYKNEYSNRSAQSSVDRLDEGEVSSSTPLKNDPDIMNSAANSTVGSIQLARKVSISSHGNKKTQSATHSIASSVKRVDSINVHKNRRIRSAGSFNDDKFEIVNSSRNVTPVLKQVSQVSQAPQVQQVEQKDVSGQPANISLDDFSTPLTSTVSIPETSNFKPYQSVGSKVDLELGSDDEDKNDHRDSEEAKTLPTFYNASRGSSDKLNGYDRHQDGVSSTSSFPDPRDQSRHGNVHSAVSDTTMTSFLDNYTNTGGSYNNYSSREQIHNVSSSSLAFSSSEALPQDDHTPLVANEAQFEKANDPSTPLSSKSGSQNETNITSPEKEELQKAAPPTIIPESSNVPGTRALSTSNNPFDKENFVSPVELQYNSQLPQSSAMEKSPNNQDMSRLYDRLNDLKKSLTEKMVIANEKIVGLEHQSYQQKQESDSLKAQLLEKNAIIESLTQNHSLAISDHLAKVDHLSNLVSTHERSIGNTNSQLEDLKIQLQEKDREILGLKSTHTDNQSKLSQYEILLNDRLLNLDKFNRVLQKQKDFVQQQQLKHIQKEELMLKRINELILSNENLRIEFDNYKRMHELRSNASLEEDEIIHESKSRNVSSAFSTLQDGNISIDDDENEFNDTSISELSHGLDKLISTIRSVSNGNQ